MGAALADDIGQCDGLSQMMSLWTFSAVFEEGGPDTAPFHGQFGLIGPGGIRKPGFTAFSLLHRLGNRRIAVDGGGALATRRDDGSLAIALWNLAPPDRAASARQVVLRLDRASPARAVRLTLLDAQHGNSQTRYQAMGSPTYPTVAQIAELNRAAALPEPQNLTPDSQGQIRLTLEPNALALIEVVATQP
jgi:xylan 1,4-beta-xylosidase